VTQPTVNGSPSQLAWTTTASTTLTLAHNHPGGNCIVIDAYSGDSAPLTLNTLTSNGVACTRATAACGSVTQSGVTNMVERWYILSPSTGSQNIVATFSGNTMGSITAQSWNDVNTSSPITAASFVFANASTPAPSVTLSPTANDVITAGLVSADTNSTADITVSVGTAVGTTTRDAVFSATAALSAMHTGSTITYALTNSTAYGMGYYVLQGSGGGGGGSLAVERLIWMN
jgi:hypothetical protein